MNSMKGKSAMLMTKGIMDVRHDPPRLICTVLTFQHPETRKEVTLYPLPNMAAPSYFKRVLDPVELTNRYDRILCEDGRLPFQEGGSQAARQKFLKAAFPFFSLRPVANNEQGEKFDGIEQRDAVESRMAYQMILDGWEPPIDPRARRGVERIESYDNGTRVAVPWGVYHMPYMRYRLMKEGFVQSNSEEVVVFGFREVFFALVMVSIGSFMFTFLLFSMFFW